MSVKTILGCSGVSRSGKDTFCELLIEILAEHGYTSKRFALADQLKKDINPFLNEKFGIDIFNCPPEEKEAMRPLLVAYGKARRIQTDGTYWTSMLQEEIEVSNVDVAIVTDIRYNQYPQDELFWLQKQMGGLLVHIKRYSLENGVENFIQPPNEDEANEDPKLESAATANIIWNTVDKGGQLYYVKQFYNKILTQILSKP